MRYYRQTKFQFLSHLWLKIVISSFLALVAACNSDKDSVLMGRGPNHLYSQAVNILGFEDTQWDGVNGNSTNHTEGNLSGEVNVSGWTVVESPALSTLGTSLDALTVDLYLPEAANWGDVRVVVKIPSAGIYYQELSSVQLSALSAGSFNTVNFTLPESVKTAISGTYTDLTVSVIINGPGLSAPYLLDNLQVVQTSTSDINVDTAEIVPVDPNAVDFSFTLPVSVVLDSVVVETAESMSLSDAVHAANQPAHVVNMGIGMTDVGAEAQIDGNIYSVGSVLLRERSTIHGFVKSAGSVEQQNLVTVDDYVSSNTVIKFGGDIAWTVNWPEASVSYTQEPDTSLDLEPGAYVSVSLKPRSTLTLHGGTYYFDMFYGDPESTIYVNGDGEPVIIYVKDALTSRSQLVHSTTSADLFIGYAGSGVVDLDGPFAGTVVAPHATIRLAPLNGGSHEGSFFANRVEAEARTPINFLPFDHWDAIFDLCKADKNKVSPGVCGCGFPDDDRDGDGYADCIDLCKEDPLKTEPGVAGCGFSDNEDMDNDGIPDAVDPWSDDYGQEHSLQCADAPDGSPCNDGVCGGISTCNNGHCGDPEDCKPQCDGTCRLFALEKRSYWVCDCETSWHEAESICENSANAKLVSLDSPFENAFISHVTEFSGIDNAWIGANDLSREGAWRWTESGENDGRLFYVGGPDGKSHYSVVLDWMDGEPGGENSENCAALKSGAAGGWYDDNCSSAKPFICEANGQKIPRIGLDSTFDHTGLPERTKPCIATSNYVELADEAEFLKYEDKLEECGKYETKKDWDDHNCDETPIGSVPSGNNCDPVELDNDYFTLPQEYKIAPTRDCQLDGPRSSFFTMADYDHNGIFSPKICQNDSDCRLTVFDPGHCGKVYTCYIPLLGNTMHACEPGDGGDALCNDYAIDLLESTYSFLEYDSDAVNAKCLAIQGCGTVSADSPNWQCFHATSPASDLCDEQVNCDPIDKLVVKSKAIEENFEKPRTVEDQFPDLDTEAFEEDTDTAYNSSEFDDPCPDSKDSDGNCDFSGVDHPWCSYNVDDKIVPSSISNVDLLTDEKADNGKIQNAKSARFKFDPQFDWDYDLTPGPLGIVLPGLRTHAGVLASVTVNSLFKDNKSTTKALIDAQLNFGIGFDEAKKLCGITTRDADGNKSTLSIFGVDFLPTSIQNLNMPSDLDQKKCIEAYSSFKNAVDRAKKAMRDAQELLRQYKKLKADKKRLPYGVLCETLLGEMESESKNFYLYNDNIDKYSAAQYLPTPEELDNGAYFKNDSYQNCQFESPERTINKFIDYYQNYTISFIKDKARFFINKIKDIEYNGTIYEWGDEKETTLFSQTFMVGPVPCNLEVFLSMMYGFEISGVAQLSVNDLFDTLFTDSVNSQGNEFASLSLNAEPYAATRVGLFVGVGFDVGFAAAKAGIDGIISLGEISVPGEASLGLIMEAKNDGRTLDGELADYSLGGSDNTVQYAIRPKKMSFSMKYGASLRLAFTDILSGEIGLRVKLAFLFFSKVWHKEIASWTGLCPKNIEDRQKWCDIPLVDLGGTTSLGDKINPFGSVKLPLPFVQLNRLDESDTVDPNLEVVEPDLNRVKEFGYHSGCPIPLI